MTDGILEIVNVVQTKLKSSHIIVMVIDRKVFYAMLWQDFPFTAFLNLFFSKSEFSFIHRDYHPEEKHQTN